MLDVGAAQQAYGSRALTATPSSTRAIMRDTSAAAPRRGLGQLQHALPHIPWWASERAKSTEIPQGIIFQIVRQIIQLLLDATSMTPAKART